MRTAFSVFFALMLVLGTATVFAWEGTATIAPGGDLPGGGYSIATNSFPVNTTVEVINLENGKIVRVNVISGLNTMGLMATLSREAATAIDLYGNSSCRIRMSQSTHEISVSQLKLGPVVNPVITNPLMRESMEGEPEIASMNVNDFTEPTGTSLATAVETVNPTYENIPLTFTPEDSYYPTTVVNQAPEEVNKETVAEAKVDNSDFLLASSDSTIGEKDDNTFLASAVSSTDSFTDEKDTETVLVSVVAPTETEETKTGGASASRTITGIITLYPSEERLPEVSYREISPEYLAPPLARTEYVPPADFSPFQVPLISRLERGKYYVQVAAYARPDNVEDEINRIGRSFPLAIQNIGTDSNPLFRVLLGPLNNQSESSAMLQRFKSIGYTDAFVWRN
jgi:cell division protein FtsN